MTAIPRPHSTTGRPLTEAQLRRQPIVIRLQPSTAPPPLVVRVEGFLHQGTRAIPVKGTYSETRPDRIYLEGAIAEVFPFIEARKVMHQEPLGVRRGRNAPWTSECQCQGETVCDWCSIHTQLFEVRAAGTDETLTVRARVIPQVHSWVLAPSSEYELRSRFKPGQHLEAAHLNPPGIDHLDGAARAIVLRCSSRYPVSKLADRVEIDTPRI